LIKNMRMPREGDKRYNLPALQKLADVLGLEFYFGPPRQTGPVETVVLNNEAWAAVPRLDVRLSAGPGAVNEDAPEIDKLAFRRDWLDRMGLRPDRAVLVRVRGDSMEPDLHDGDLALVDTARTLPRPRGVYALTDIGGETLVKHVDALPGQGLILRSVNPDWPAIPRLGEDAARVVIHGQVVWSGHVWER
jgi:phage repressor protein C with HTH and peptisase S24 domain